MAVHRSVLLVVLNQELSDLKCVSRGEIEDDGLSLFQLDIHFVIDQAAVCSSQCVTVYINRCIIRIVQCINGIFLIFDVRCDRHTM